MVSVKKHNYIPYFYTQDVYIQNYTFTENFTMPNAGVTYTIKNPYQSRLFLAAGKAVNRNYVFMSPTATDFRKVEGDMKWNNVLELKTSVARVLAISEDGDCLFSVSK